MKLRLITILICLVAGQAVHAQIAAEDASGQTTIVTRNSSAAISIGDAALSVNWNNFRRLAVEHRNQVLWGLDASVRNTGGMNDLFNGGKITPESRFGGFIGWRHNLVSGRFEVLADMDRLKKSDVPKKYLEANRYQEMVARIIKNCSPDTVNQKRISSFIRQISQNAPDIRQLTDAIGAFKWWDEKDMSCVQTIRDSLTHRQNLISQLQKQYNDYQTQLQYDQNALIESGKAHKNQAITFYINGGLNANSLNFYDTVGTPLANRFSTVNFQGAFADAGINYDLGARWTFGLSAGIEHFNNIDSLGSTDYTLKSTLTQGTDQLITKDKITAYSGSYVVYDRANIRTDALYWGKVSDDYELVWNVLYTRFMLPLKEQRINSSINAGSAINFYKTGRKFAGGFYVQSNDVFNNMQSTDNWTRRLSFRVIAKYSFDSIVSRLFEGGN